MAETNPSSVSARGAFIIGLSLGAGVLLVYSVLQSSRMNNELKKLENDLVLMEKRIANANAELSNLRTGAPTVEK